MRFSRSLQGACIAGIAGSMLSGCYVAPYNPPPSHASTVIVSPAPPLQFTARLYPANDGATRFGVVLASITNNLNGHGTFSVNLDGESLTGEATRTANGGRSGTANGAGSRGSWIRCTYSMNSPTLGSGTCESSHGAAFNMHIGN